MTVAELKVLADDTANTMREHEPRLASLLLLEVLVGLYARAKLEVLEDWERTTARTCELCGEPSGDGGAICPACRESR